jgi:hypothetical protein
MEGKEEEEVVEVMEEVAAECGRRSRTSSL